MRIRIQHIRDLALLALGLLVMSTAACRGGRNTGASPTALTGDWDYYRMLGAAPSGGFEARRRFGFAHFEGTDLARELAAPALRRRPGAGERSAPRRGLPLPGLRQRRGPPRPGARRYHRRPACSGAVKPADRVWLVRGARPPEYERNYPLWPGEVSDSSFAVTIDPAVPMTGPGRHDPHELRGSPGGARALRRRHGAHAVSAGGHGGGRLLGVPRLHLREAGRARPRRLRRRAGHERRPGAGRLRRRGVGRGAARGATARWA